MILPDISLSCSKQITIILNGQPSNSFTFSYSPPLSLAGITKQIESKWGNKIKRLRIFNQDGVEFYAEDIRYLKERERVYVSLRGEDFDANSSYGEYQVMREIGEGGFGKVFFGRHKQSQQPVAIKLMKAGSFDGVGQVDTVFAEAQNLQALNHENIVKIINCYALKEMQVVVIMEYMAGGELLQLLLQKKRFTQNEARVLFRQMISAVSYCHSKNIIHRDLKLENILLKEKGSMEIKIADFGIASVRKQFNPQANVGTLRYMPPEILLGTEKGTTMGVDVWSLGVILYFMVTGKQPFNGNSYSEISKGIIYSQHQIPAEVSVSEELQDLIGKLLTKDPKHRIKVNEIKDHIWFKVVQGSGILSLRAQNTNLTCKNTKKHRESMDQISQRKRIAKVIEREKGLMRPSISIPKKLEKQKDVLMRELMKYGKIKGNPLKGEDPPRLVNRRMSSINECKLKKASFE